MKVRNGFVSNSSSSSFVIGLPKGETLTQRMLQQIGFIGKNSIQVFDFLPKISAGEAATYLFQRAHKLTKKELNSWIQYHPDKQEELQAKAKEFTLWTIHVDDDNTTGAHLENHDWYTKFKYGLRISNH